MSKRLLVAIGVIIVIIVVGMVTTMKRSLKAGAMANDPDATMPRPATPPPSR